jgi:hypothetical protein
VHALYAKAAATHQGAHKTAPIACNRKPPEELWGAFVRLKG